MVQCWDYASGFECSLAEEQKSPSRWRTPVLGRLRLKDGEVQASLGYIPKLSYSLGPPSFLPSQPCSVMPGRARKLAGSPLMGLTDLEDFCSGPLRVPCGLRDKSQGHVLRVGMSTRKELQSAPEILSLPSHRIHLLLPPPFLSANVGC